MDDQEETFDNLHAALTDTLLDRIKNGEEIKTKEGGVINVPVTAATLNVARQWLNDNQVSADPSRSSRLKKLKASVADLPFQAGEKAH